MAAKTLHRLTKQAPPTEKNSRAALMVVIVNPHLFASLCPFRSYIIFDNVMTMLYCLRPQFMISLSCFCFFFLFVSFCLVAFFVDLTCVPKIKPVLS
jgi:hypothetical protein